MRSHGKTHGYSQRKSRQPNCKQKHLTPRVEFALKSFTRRRHQLRLNLNLKMSTEVQNKSLVFIISLITNRLEWKYNKPGEKIKNLISQSVVFLNVSTHLTPLSHTSHSQTKNHLFSVLFSKPGRTNLQVTDLRLLLDVRSKHNKLDNKI